jgi:hypothetical protein
MRTWAEELRKHTHDYVRRGGKQNRKKQVSLIINFLEFTASQDKFTSIHELGRRHVINFWKSHRDLPEKTAYDYWLGICKLWEWIGKKEKPPKPNTFSKGEEIPNKILHFSSLSQAVKYSMNKKEISADELARISKCELTVINKIGCGKTDICFSDVERVLKSLNIKFLID